MPADRGGPASGKSVPHVKGRPLVQPEPTPDDVPKDLIAVAVVGAPHGVRGESRLKSFTEEPMAATRYGPLVSPDGRTRLKVASARLLRDDLLVVRFEGIGDRDAAAMLTGTRLHVARTALPEPEEDEFYNADLIGLRVEQPDGTLIGRIVTMLNHGAGDLLEVQPTQSGETLLIAFTRAFVPVVDVAGGRIVVVPEALGNAGDDEEDAPT